MKKTDANHWEKSGARFDLCTVYGHMDIHTPTRYQVLPNAQDVGFLV